jgi:hypothetical protein
LETLLELKAKYMQGLGNLEKMGVREIWEKSDHAQLVRPSSFRRSVTGFVLLVALSVMPLAAQEERTVTFPIGDADIVFAVKNPANSIKNLLNAPDRINRMRGLELVKRYLNNENSIDPLMDIIRSSSHSDVQEELFKFMVERKDYDLRLFIQIINQAEAQNRKDLVNLAYQSFEDVLNNDPTIIDHLTYEQFTPNSIYSNVNPQIAQRVFLTILAADPDSIAVNRLLQSNYWSPGNLAEIYNELSTYAANHPNEPQIPSIKKLAEATRRWILQKAALEKLPRIFYKGTFNKLPDEAPKGDINALVRIGELEGANRKFLRTSPKVQSGIDPKAYPEAEQEVQALINSNKADLNLSRSPLGDFFYVPKNLSYFNALEHAEAKRQYIDITWEAKNISELARILQSSKCPAFLRPVVSDYLMRSREGRLLLLDIYLRSSDIGLRENIAGLGWLTYIYQDAQSVGDPNADRIFREALKEMYIQAKKEWMLDARLDTYSDVELHFLDDPRGEGVRQAQIEKEATRWAKDNLQERWRFRVEVRAGHGVSTPQELELITAINHGLENTHDPRRFLADFDNFRVVHAQDPGFPELFKDVVSVRDAYTVSIKGNDQNIPEFPSPWGWFKYLMIAGVIVTIGTSLLWNKLKYWASLLIADEFQLISISKKQQKNGGNGNGNGWHAPKDKAMTTIPVNQVYAPVSSSLQTWQNLMDKWSPSTELPADVLTADFNTILNLADKMIRLMPYSPDLVWDYETQSLNQTYQESYRNFDLLAKDTLLALSVYLQNEGLSARLNESQRWRLLQDVDTMLKKIEYVSLYLEILDDRGNIERALSYKYPYNNWREWGPYVLSRTISLYQRLWKKPSKSMEDKLRKLLKMGNLLMPGSLLYENTNGIVDESVKRLKTVIRYAKTYSIQSPKSRSANKKKNFMGQMLFLVSFLGISSTALLYFLGVRIYEGINLETIILAASVEFLAWFIYFVQYTENTSKADYRMTKRIRDKLNKKLKRLLDPSGKYKNDERSAEQKIVDLAKQEGAKEITTELGPDNVPRVDAIVIIAEDPRAVWDLKEHMDSLRGRVIRTGIPVEIISPKYGGSGNAYYEALQMVKKNFETHKGKYSNAKPWQEARVLYIFHGQEAIRENTLIDWGIANGYRAAAAMSKLAASNGSANSGAVVIFSRDFYAGPIEQVPGSDTTILTTRVNRNDLSGLGWVRTSFSKSGDTRISEIREKEDFRGSLTMKFLKEEKYDPHNYSLKQFLAFNGVILMGSDAVAEDVRIAERLQESGLMRLLPLHLTSDVLIPKLKARNPDDIEWDEDIDAYVNNRARWPDMNPENARERSHLALADIAAELKSLCGIIGSAVNPNENILPELTRLYNLVGKVVSPKKRLKQWYSIIREARKPDSEMHTYVPHSGGALYVPNITGENGGFQKVQELLRSFTHSAQEPDFAQASKHTVISTTDKSRGGIDLAFQPQFIRRPSPAVTGSMQEAGAHDIFDGLKGFDFNIVRFTSQLTVSGAFQLMFSSN